LRRTKAAQNYRKTGNLRAVQLLLGHTKLESTVRYLGIEVDDALNHLGASRTLSEADAAALPSQGRSNPEVRFAICPIPDPNQARCVTRPRAANFTAICDARFRKRSLPRTVHLFQRYRWRVDGQSDILEQVEVPLLGAEDHHMDTEAWLQGLGLERYVPAFRDNEIDREVLPKLISEDLREIGVAAIGHRRKLLDAISALGGSAPTAAVKAPADAERRQITVMFRDLVGSTAPSTRFVAARVCSSPALACAGAVELFLSDAQEDEISQQR
jgi:hypothetical protein